MSQQRRAEKVRSKIATKRVCHPPSIQVAKISRGISQQRAYFHLCNSGCHEKTLSP